MSTVHLILSVGAHLVFNELIESTLFEGLTFGLTDGWWMFVDREIRSNFPLMRPAEWKYLFAGLNFETLAYTSEIGAFEGQAIVVARKYFPNHLMYPDRDGPNLKVQGSYLMTGGLGGLGLMTARILVQHGAASISLISRRNTVPEESQKDFTCLMHTSALIIR
jgi:hypothetical protein